MGTNIESCGENLLYFFVANANMEKQDYISHTWGEQGKRKLTHLQAKNKEAY